MADIKNVFFIALPDCVTIILCIVFIYAGPVQCNILILVVRFVSYD